MRLLHHSIASCLLFSTAATLAQGLPPLQHLPTQLVQPARAASFALVNDRMVLTSDWIPLNGASLRDGRFFEAAFDSGEYGMVGGKPGLPTDNLPGCTAQIPPGNRWFFGLDYNTPLVASDLRTSPGGAGSACEGLSFSFHINVGAAEPDTNGDGLPDANLFVAVSTFETMDVVVCSNPGGGFIDGVIYDFSNTTWPSAIAQTLDISLVGTGLAHTMPADGVGGYQVLMGRSYNPVTGEFEIPTGIDSITHRGVSVQPMLWGTGDNEPIDDGRAGHDVDGMFEDGLYSVPDGQVDFSDCGSFLFGVCPDPLTACIAFWMKSRPRPCPCDLNGNGQIEIGDLSMLLASFGSVAPYIPTPDADIDRDGDVDLADLTLLLACFGASC